MSMSATLFLFNGKRLSGIGLAGCTSHPMSLSFPLRVRNALMGWTFSQEQGDAIINIVRPPRIDTVEKLRTMVLRDSSESILEAQRDDLLVEEAFKDLLWREDSGRVSLSSGIVGHNAAIIEAYRRGQKSVQYRTPRF